MLVAQIVLPQEHLVLEVIFLRQIHLAKERKLLRELRKQIQSTCSLFLVERDLERHQGEYVLVMQLQPLDALQGISDDAKVPRLLHKVVLVQASKGLKSIAVDNPSLLTYL